MSPAIAPTPASGGAKPVEPRPYGYCDIATPRVAPIALWRVAHWFIGVLHMLFGAPEDVAAQGALRLAAHRQLAQWLACAEAMLRRLLLIEAAAYAKPNTRPLLRQPRQRVRRLIAVYPDKPEFWRVSFRVLVPPTLRQAQGDAEGDAAGSVRVGLSLSKAKRPARVSREDRWSYENFKPVQLRETWALAERYEACLRVFNNPAPYARRLSRRLHATPHRHVEALRAPPEARHRIDRFDELTELAVTPWRERRSSA